MKVLLCAAEAPIAPLDGLSLVVDHVARGLSERHDVRVLALGERAVEYPGGVLRVVPRPRRGRMGDVTAVVRAMVSRRPVVVRALTTALERPLAEELQAFDPDVVHVVSGRLGLLAQTIGARPSVLTAVDAWHLNVEAQESASHGLRRFLLASEVGRVRRFEATSWSGFDRVVMVTDSDADVIREVAPGLPLRVITNGVDLGESPEVPVDPHRVVFHGVLRYPPNVLACERLVKRVMPLVRAELPSASLTLVGRDPSPEVQALSSLAWVDVVGEVAEVAPWLAGSRVYACVVDAGTGVKNKVLEAMAAGVAVVSTPLGLRGLATVPGEHVLQADDDAAIARAIVDLLVDSELARRIGAAGRHYVERRHQWPAVVRQYEALYEEIRAGS